MAHPVVTISADIAPCQGYGVHLPKSIINEMHHVFPVELQKLIWPETNRDKPDTIRHKEQVALCGTCHNNVHAYINALKAGKPTPKISKLATAIAVRGYLLYKTELANTEKFRVT